MGIAILMGLAGLYYYLNFTTPRKVAEIPLTVEGKTYARSLKLSDVDMKATSAYFGSTLIEIEGKVANAGDRALDTVDIYCVFYDGDKQMVLRKRVPIVSRKMGGLKPGETKSFRLPFDEIPTSWNQALPTLVIAGLTFS
jgi:hypothetical protein